MTRFFDDGVWLGWFGGEILAACPRCGHRARWLATTSGIVAPARAGTATVASAHGVSTRGRLDCVHCALARAGVSSHALTLWLSTRWRSEDLWAYNELHLGWLTWFVASELRERRRSPEGEWANGTMASRLPRWMKASRNRDAILRCLRELQSRAASASLRSVNTRGLPR